MATIAFEAATAQPRPADSDEFGNYRIQRVLGEGGMGTVYRAEQTAPIRRAVALKVVKMGMDSSHVLSRFAYERMTAQSPSRSCSPTAKPHPWQASTKPAVSRRTEDLRRVLEPLDERRDHEIGG
ncbi:MAG TPA: hypothetical protein VME43_27875 [Bryobacteraceae bacterium]|nr:hypothetical protein [Bryobacteraceae bacterium]